MQISELIQKLNEIQAKHGDMRVAILDPAAVMGTSIKHIEDVQVICDSATLVRLLVRS